MSLYVYIHVVLPIITICYLLYFCYVFSFMFFLSFHLPFCSYSCGLINIVFMTMGGQLDGLLSHWQPAFCK